MSFGGSKKLTIIEKLILLVICLIVIAIPTSCAVIPLTTQESVTFRVQDKERVARENSSQYLIFTDTETFCNKDSFILGKWNSSDIYGDIERGATYRATVYGWRMPLFSSYRNIIDVTRINGSDRPQYNESYSEGY